MVRTIIIKELGLVEKISFWSRLFDFRCFGMHSHRGRWERDKAWERAIDYYLVGLATPDFASSASA